MIQAFSNRTALVLLVVLAVVRGGMIAGIPETALSTDMHSWSKVAKDLAAGWNPYQTTCYLNWPPLWMQFLYVLSLVARATGIALSHVIQAFLVCGEALLVLLSLGFLRRFLPERRAAWLLLWGIVLNPVALFLVCQHGNFDVLVGLVCLLAVVLLVQHAESHDPADWLLASLFIGTGILLKTVPAVLVPLLFAGLRNLPTFKYRVLGWILVLGPVALGLGVLWPLAPDAVVLKVVAYRSSPGWFGFSAIMAWLNWQHWYGLYGAVYLLLLLAGMVWLARYLYTRGWQRVTDPVLYAALLLMSIPVLGPGYAPQYVYWFMPLLLLVYPRANGQVRRTLWCLYGIAAVTYTIEYACCFSHGAWLLQVIRSERLAQWADRMSTASAQAALRLPLFLALGAAMVQLSRALCCREGEPATHQGTAEEGAAPLCTSSRSK